MSFKGTVWRKTVTPQFCIILLFVPSCPQVATYVKEKEDTFHCHDLINLPCLLTVWFWIVKEKGCSSAALPFLYLFFFSKTEGG